MRVFVGARTEEKEVALARHLRELAKEKPRIAELFCRGDAKLRALVFDEPQPDRGQEQLPLPGLGQARGR